MVSMKPMGDAVDGDSDDEANKRRWLSEAAARLREAEAEVERLREAVASAHRRMADTSGANLANVWLAVEELRRARQVAESLLRDAQELADRALDAMDSPVDPKARPRSGVFVARASLAGTKTGSGP